jgi:hypothetical protein
MPISPPARLLSFLCLTSVGIVLYTHRKNISMRMAVKTETQSQYNLSKHDVHGRLKSDITENKEKIYERSYY